MVADVNVCGASCNTAVTSASIPLPWGGESYTVGLANTPDGQLGNFLVPRSKFLSSPRVV